MSAQAIYQWYAELEDYRPKMWRRFQTLDDISVANFCYTVMTLFEMDGDHLFSIDHERPLITPSGKQSRRTELIGRYAIPYDDGPVDWDDNIEDADAVQVSELDLAAHSFLVLWYDFGDDWKVRIKLEKKLDAGKVPGNELPRVLEGAGSGIVEDCGGPFGLEDLAEAFKEKKGERYEQYHEWLDVDDLDLETFDIDAMNSRLKTKPDSLALIYG